MPLWHNVHVLDFKHYSRNVVCLVMTLLYPINPERITVTYLILCSSMVRASHRSSQFIISPLVSGLISIKNTSFSDSLIIHEENSNEINI